MALEIHNESFLNGPEFWVSTYDEIMEYLKTLKKGEVQELTHSAGGNRIPAVFYGKKEEVHRSANFSSAIGARDLQSFLGSPPRIRQVFLVMAGIHGSEPEGCVTAINLINILEKGVDLDGREWPALSNAFKEMRVIILPTVNPDGRIRSRIKNLVGASTTEAKYIGAGKPREGELPPWPEYKRYHPMRREDMIYLGGIYNDDGINIQHDNFFSNSIANETRALLDLVEEETPDCFINLHSCIPGPFMNPPNACIPSVYQVRWLQIGALVGDRLQREGLQTSDIPISSIPDFNLDAALLYHSGAQPLSFEFPHGMQVKPFTFEEILDIGLIMLEEVVNFGVKYGFRPKWNL